MKENKPVDQTMRVEKGPSSYFRGTHELAKLLFTAVEEIVEERPSSLLQNINVGTYTYAEVYSAARALSISGRHHEIHSNICIYTPNEQLEILRAIIQKWNGLDKTLRGARLTPEREKQLSEERSYLLEKVRSLIESEKFLTSKI